MTREELRDRVAEEMWQAESLRAVGQRRVIKWSDAGPPTWDHWLPLADAAIALVLEEAAKVFDDMWSLSIRPSAAANAIRALIPSEDK